MDGSGGRAAMGTSGRDRYGHGVACSLLVHGLVAMMLLLQLPGREPPPVPQIIPVNLVTLGPESTAPPGPTAELPQDAAPAAQPGPPNPVLTLPRPPQSATDLAMAAPAPPLAPPLPSPPQVEHLTAAAAPEQVVSPRAPALVEAPPLPSPPRVEQLATTAEPEEAISPSAARLSETAPLPRPAPVVHVAHPAAKPPVAPPSPADAFQQRLKALAQLRQPSAPATNGEGASNVAVRSADARTGRQASYGVKDQLKQQILRRWNLNLGAPGARDYVVSIHLSVGRDGRIGDAEILSDPRFRDDPVYAELAAGARNAALLAQPLQFPQEQYALVREVTLDFRARDVLQ